jgi:hypothetical protein
MDEAGVEPQPLLDRGTLTEHSADPLVDEAGRQLRAPWAAGLAGILFAVLFTGALLLIRSSPLTAASNAQLVQLFAQGRDQWLLIGGLYLAPFAGIMFLWFIAVVRDQVGEREDRFFATVFLGSGLIFVALVFAAAAVASTVAVAVRELGLDAPTVPEVELVRAIAYTLLFGFATRAAAVFLFSTATLGLRSGALPRWLALIGYLIGLVLLLVVTFWDWIILLFPAWVAVASVFLIRRARSQRNPVAA